MNVAGFPILSLITYLPLLGVAYLATLRGEEVAVARQARHAALGISLLVLALGVYLWTQFNPAEAGYQFVESATWFPGLDIKYSLGVDGISLFLILLTLVLTPIAILSSATITKRA